MIDPAEYPYAHLTDDEIDALVNDHVHKLHRIIDLCVCRALADDKRVTDRARLMHGNAIISMMNRGWKRPTKMTRTNLRLANKWRNGQ